MKTTQIFTVFVFCCTVFSLFAQSNNEIVGQVIDAGTRQPLPDAYIIYQNKSRGTIVDTEGRFKLSSSQIKPADDTLYITHLGYQVSAMPWTQEKGLLSPRKAKKYKCNLDSSFMLNQYPVYVLRIKWNNEVGTVQIIEVDDHYLIRRFHVKTQDYWSTAWHERLPAEVSVQFQYIGNTPFVKEITAVQRKDDLEYRNELVSLVQKLDTFSVTSDEYWNMNTYSINPNITFDPAVYNLYVPDGIRKQYDLKKKLFDAVGIDLDEEVKIYTDRWFLSEPGENKAISWIEELRERIF